MFTPTNERHVFHTDACRAAYRRTHTPGMGEVKRLQQLKDGKWSITIHLTQQPDAQVGQKIALTRDCSRLEQETGQQP